METSEEGLKFIEKNEGLSLRVYNDRGHKAVGYGHDLISGEYYPDGITQEKAQELLKSDVSKWEKAINSYNLPLTQCQFDSLCDFTHNLGVGSLSKLLAHGLFAIPVQMIRWDHVDENGKMVESPGLLTRRRAEAEMFNKVSG
jgi:lysozyme